jgi:hypothetical protein
MGSYGRSLDYVGLNPTCKAGDPLVLNDDDVIDLLKAAVKGERGQSAFAKRHDVNRTELNSILNGRRRISASVAKALGLRRVYVAERSCVTQKREASASAASMANKVEDDLRDDDGDRGAENDTQNSHPHASRSFI